MRLERRAVFGWPATAAGTAACRNGLAVHYDGFDQGLARKDHAACRAYWKATRKFHMGPSRGWLDIGYSFAVCPHGVVMEGRGWQRQQAAQPGGNSTWTSVTFCTGDDERPTTAQVTAFKELRAWLRGKGLAAAIRGHRDFSSTSCPGGILYDMVKNGALTGAPAQEDDLPSPKEVWQFEIDAPWVAEGGDDRWQADTHLRVMHQHVRDLEKQVAALKGDLAAVRTANTALQAQAAANGQRLQEILALLRQG